MDTCRAAGSTMDSAVSSSRPSTHENTSNSFNSHDTGFWELALRYVITVVLWNHDSKIIKETIYYKNFIG